MKQVGLFEAKTHLAQLVDELAEGRTAEIVLTRRGKPVACLVPAARRNGPSSEPGERPSAVFARIRKESSLEGTSIRELIEEGRRY